MFSRVASGSCVSQPVQPQPQPPLRPPAQQVPEGLPLHVLVCDAVIDKGLIPDRVPGVPQSFCTELVGLQPREMDRHLPWWEASPAAPSFGLTWGRWVGDIGVHSPYECPGAQLLANACSQ